MAKHRLVELEEREARCKCGWFSCLLEADGWGPVSGRNELLDRYNRHRRRTLMRRDPQRPDERDE